MTDDAPGDDADQVRMMLDATRTSVLELIERTSVHPASVRLSVGEISVEMEWAHAAPSSPGAPAITTTAPAEPPDGGGAGTAATTPVTAPAVGVFYRAPEPGAAPFVDVGDTVAPGQRVGLIEAMKLMIPVEADRHGTVGEVLGANGAAVEYGQPLLTLIPLTGQE